MSIPHRKFSLHGPAAAILAALVCGAVPAHASILAPNAFSSLGALSLTDTSGAYVFDTGTGGSAPTLRDPSGSLLYTGVFSPGAAVFDFSSVFLGTGVVVKAVGSTPLALLSTGNIDIKGRLNADGSDAAGATGGAGGAGGGRGGDAAWGGGTGPGGGLPQGGLPAFGQGGGFGGHGGNGFGGVGGVSYGDLHVQLEGGSGGGASGANLFGSAAGGGGGGAIELGALGVLNVDGGAISADGGGGGGGTAILAGGGSGGGLLLHASHISFTGPATDLSVDGGGAFGGGGRILILTATGTLDSFPVNLSANPAPTGGAQAGVIEFGTLSAVPVPAAVWLFGTGLAGLGLTGRRRIQ